MIAGEWMQANLADDRDIARRGLIALIQSNLDNAAREARGQ